MKSAFAIALLVAVAGIVPQAHAVGNTATIKLMVAGSSALWQSMGLATYGFNGSSGNCPSGAVKPCFHYTSSSNFSLNDARPKNFATPPGSIATDTGQIWIVWDSHTTSSGSSTFSTPNVWAFIRVDSAVGVRCYFAHPRCYATAPSTWPTPAGNAGINSALWGADTDPNNCGGTCNGGSVVTAFQAATGVVIGAAASDIRPEDALWATCRANSALDTSTTLGLGYNSAIPAGQCPTSSTPKSNLAGTDIISKVNTGHTAHPIAFNLSGTDPYSGQAIPAFSTFQIGGEPVMIVGAVAKGGGTLASVNNVTDSQLQSVFSGANCNANAFKKPDGTTPGSDSLNVYQREALSGTMNTIEYTVFAYPDFSGTSQETGIDPSVDNPLSQACTAGGGTRKRGVGTGDIITGVWTDGTGALTDAIGYTFFSYGNVTNGTKSINDSGSFKYFTLNGVDPLFHKYASSAGSTFSQQDPGQPITDVGEIPGPTDNGTCTGTFPCPENKIWNGGLSFPNVRSGQYRAWSVLRYISDGANFATAKTLLTAAQSFAASTTPDFIPVAPVIAKPSAVPPVPPDPGLSLLRAHYQQIDNGGHHLGGAPVNDSTSAFGPDTGGDVGGCIEHALPATTQTAASVAQTDSTTNLVQNAPGSECAAFSTH
jgi:hypothetical protein